MSAGVTPVLRHVVETAMHMHQRHRYSEPTDSRSARSEYNDLYDDETITDYSHHDPRSPPLSFHQPQQPHDIRAATPTTLPSALTTQRFPCANCGADHKSTDCDSTKCTTCQATFPTAALRQAHYIAHHKRDNPNKRTLQHYSTQPQPTYPANLPVSIALRPIHGRHDCSIALRQRIRLILLHFLRPR